MISNKRYVIIAVKIIFAVFPFVEAFYYYIPFFLEKETNYPILDAIYSSLKIYSGVLESDMDITLGLHIARFMGMSITLSILISALNKLSDIMNRLRLISKDSYIVYGSSVYASKLCDDIGKRHIVTNNGDFIRGAHNYVLMFPNDTQNLEFYAKHADKMKNSKVVMMLEDTERQSIMCNDVISFSIPECCARFFWKKYYPVKSEKIGLIGFGRTGQNLLTFGLQMNIISPDQHFEYHIWGDPEEYRCLHGGLDKMDPDIIVFHEKQWFSDLEIIDELDRLIICGNESLNISILGKLLGSGHNNSEIYIFVSNKNVVEEMFGNERNVHCFGMAEEIATKENIIYEETMKNAKAQHEYYVEKYGGEPWEKLNAFIRYSNVSSSDFEYVINRLYKENVTVETLAHLEHIRWCRYYYLNNWVYGSVRNNSKRIHNCLIPYEELSEEEKQKDIESVSIKIGK